MINFCAKDGILKHIFCLFREHIRGLSAGKCDKEKLIDSSSVNVDISACLNFCRFEKTVLL